MHTNAPARPNQNGYAVFMGEHGQNRLRVIVGRSLTIVSFVHDYIQLTFDGPTLTTFTLPTFECRGALTKPGEPGYCDALCSQIGINVLDVSCTDDEITIRLESLADFKVSLRSSDYRGPEAINFTSDEGILVV